MDIYIFRKQFFIECDINCTQFNYTLDSLTIHLSFSFNFNCKTAQCDTLLVINQAFSCKEFDFNFMWYCQLGICYLTVLEKSVRMVGEKVWLVSEKVLLGVGSVRLGIGSVRLCVGLLRLGAGPARLGIGSVRLGVGSVRLGVGSVRLGGWLEWSSDVGVFQSE